MYPNEIYKLWRNTRNIEIARAHATNLKTWLDTGGIEPTEKDWDKDFFIIWCRNWL